MFSGGQYKRGESELALRGVPFLPREQQSAGNWGDRRARWWGEERC